VKIGILNVKRCKKEADTYALLHHACNTIVSSSSGYYCKHFMI